MIRTTFGAAVLTVALAGAATAEPALIFDMGGKFDKSFNEAAYNGAEKFKKEFGGTYREFEVTSPAQREQALRNFASRGYAPIVVLGFSNAEPLAKVAKEFPKVKFAIIDGVVDAPNVRSIVFKEHEGSFLVGILAAKASKSAKIGFVGGMDIPLIRKFECGYEQGAKYANPSITVIQNMTGTTPAAWNDPVKGKELTRSQMDQGADVIYAAAGGTGTGVLAAAADAGKLSIGVDSNQNHLHPGKVLTSMLKRVDVATYNAFKDEKDGKFTFGISNLGLKEQGVDWALDDNNKSLITDDMKKAVEAAKTDIIAGKISVIDYMAANKCQ